MAITTDNTFDRYKNKKTSELYTQIIEAFNYQENYLNGLSQQHLWDLCSLAVNTAPAIATGKYFYSLVNEITIRVKDFQELQETGSCQEGETCYTEEEENPDDHIDVIDQAHLSRISQQYDVPGQIPLDGESEQLLGELLACYGWEFRKPEGRLQSARKKTVNQTVVIDRDAEFPELWNYIIKSQHCVTANRYGILLASQLPEFIQAIFLQKV